jgi:hypothetical protein
MRAALRAQWDFYLILVLLGLYVAAPIIVIVIWLMTLPAAY